MPHSPNDPRPDELSTGIADLSRRMDNGFNRVEAKLERHGEAITGLDGRVTGVEGRVAALEDRMTAIEGRMAALEERMTAMEGRMAALEVRMTAMEGRMVALEGRMAGLEDRMTALESRMTAEFTAVRREISEGFQRMQRLMIQVGGGIVVTLLAASRFLG